VWVLGYDGLGGFGDVEGQGADVGDQGADEGRLRGEESIPRLEPLDPRQVAIWRRIGPVGRLEIAFQAYQFALDAVRVQERQKHPELSAEELAWRVTRRMQGDPSLGR
jgi:hypothetical protein